MSRDLWNQKSSNYPRFSGELGEFSREVFANLDKFGVNFKGKSVVDIGCGTGVYTLYIAQICREITGVDSSAGMLEVMQEDAQKFGIKNLTTINSSWLEFADQKHYDIAISTMSPAISETSDFERFNQMADLKIYLNFAKRRTSTLLEPFFAHFNVVAQMGSSARGLEEWLKKQDISYEKVNLPETRIVLRSKSEAVQNICWHLDINNAQYEKREIVEMVDKMSDEIPDTITSLMSLFVF